MNILGIGIDITNINRFKKMSSTLINKLSKKILTKLEFKKYKKEKNKILFLARSFASKEAASKALGIGIQKKIFFNNFEILYNKYGKPKINFLHRAAKIIKNKNVKKINISITDEKKYVIAIVTIN